VLRERTGQRRTPSTAKACERGHAQGGLRALCDIMTSRALASRPDERALDILWRLTAGSLAASLYTVDDCRARAVAPVTSPFHRSSVISVRKCCTARRALPRSVHTCASLASRRAPRKHASSPRLHATSHSRMHERRPLLQAHAKSRCGSNFRHTCSAHVRWLHGNPIERSVHAASSAHSNGLALAKRAPEQGQYVVSVHPESSCCRPVACAFSLPLAVRAH
jgi:hypothetical protein